MTTITTPKTLVDQEADLLSRLKAVLLNHPAASSFHLLLAPAGVTVAHDEVLVQETDIARGVVELHPRKLEGVALGDVLHATQVISLTDAEFTRYAESTPPAQYFPVQRPDGSTGHLMA